MNSDIKVERIHGGWRNVPENLKTKTQLNELGLKPINVEQYRAEVWSYKSWIRLYDVNLDTKPKKKATEKQLAALEKAREGRIKSLTCDTCGTVVSSNKYLFKDSEGKICPWCYRKEEIKVRRELAHEYALNHTFGKWFNEDFYILDTETTDLNGEVIEISIIDRSGKVIYDQLIKPFGTVSQGARSVHGISDEMLADKPTFKDIYDELKPILESKLLLIYNSFFDREVIFNSCEKWGLETPSLNTDCVMRAYADFVQSERWISLANASGLYGGHRALADCLSTLSVIKDVWTELGLIHE